MHIRTELLEKGTGMNISLVLECSPCSWHRIKIHAKIFHETDLWLNSTRKLENHRLIGFLVSSIMFWFINQHQHNPTAVCHCKNTTKNSPLTCCMESGMSVSISLKSRFLRGLP